MTARLASRRVNFLALVVLPLALTGCMRYTVEAEIHRDETISGSFIFAVKSEFVDRLFGGEARFLPELRKQLTADSGELKLLVPMKPTRGDVSLSEYRSGDLVGYRQRFEGVPLAGLDRSAIRVRHVNGRFIVDVAANVIGLGDLQLGRKPGDNADATGSERPSSPDETKDDAAKDIVADQLRSEGVDPDTVIGDQRPDLRIRLTFPGEIIATNGTVDDRSVSWRLTFDDKRTLHVSAWDSPRNRSWLPQLVLAICAVGGLGVLYQLIRYRLRRRGTAAQLPAEAQPPSLGFAGLPTLGGDSEKDRSPSQGRVGE